MRWTVLYRPSTERDLAELWLQAPDPAVVTLAANALDAALAKNPLAVGESRGGRTRIVYSKPLAALFDVQEIDRQVIVWSIWRFDD